MENIPYPPHWLNPGHNLGPYPRLFEEQTYKQCRDTTNHRTRTETNTAN